MPTYISGYCANDRHATWDVAYPCKGVAVWKEYGGLVTCGCLCHKSAAKGEYYDPTKVTFASESLGTNFFLDAKPIEKKVETVEAPILANPAPTPPVAGLLLFGTIGAHHGATGGNPVAGVEQRSTLAVEAPPAAGAATGQASTANPAPLPSRLDSEFSDESYRRLKTTIDAEIIEVCNLMFSSKTYNMQGIDAATLAKTIRSGPVDPGTIHAVLLRWEKVGFAELASKPRRIIRFTELGELHGVEWCTNQYRRRKKLKAAKMRTGLR